MKLADLVAHSSAPLAVKSLRDGRICVLDSPSNYAKRLQSCPLRYVLADELVILCADLAYSRGARTVACADLLHVPAQTLWVEWQNRAWKTALDRYGFSPGANHEPWNGRRGALILAAADGRRGSLRTFWNLSTEGEVVVSGMEAHFDLDTAEGEEPAPTRGVQGRTGAVSDYYPGTDDVLGRCFRFRYERSWADYYERAGLLPAQAEALWRHALGTIALDVPLLLTFLLLLCARGGLPQRESDPTRLNRARRRRGKPPLLAHIEVRAPLSPEYLTGHRPAAAGTRRSPRLHHVRGHLVRRGNQLFWRVPHLRGNARSGKVTSRTVIWTFDPKAAGGPGHIARR
jgi:hypothetical protein